MAATKTLTGCEIDTRLSLTEYAVLAVLAEGPTHGFAVSRELASGGDLGRVLTVRRPLIYRALDRLVMASMARPAHTENGDAGPQRVIHVVTPAGRRRLETWWETPVEHIRDIRIEFLLKVALLERADRSPLPLIRRQRETLGATIEALDDPEPDDHVELWRRHNASAARGYLADLETRFTS